jgi:hypothetical protein
MRSRGRYVLDARLQLPLMIWASSSISVPYLSKVFSPNSSPSLKIRRKKCKAGQRNDRVVRVPITPAKAPLLCISQDSLDAAGATCYSRSPQPGSAASSFSSVAWQSSSSPEWRQKPEKLFSNPEKNQEFHSAACQQHRLRSSRSIGFRWTQNTGLDLYQAAPFVTPARGGAAKCDATCILNHTTHTVISSASKTRLTKLHFFRRLQDNVTHVIISSL